MPSGSINAPVRRERHGPAWVWGPVVLYLLLIFALSSIGSPPGLPARISDKTAHVILYSGLGVLLIRALAGVRLAGARLRQALLAVAIGAAYGASDELHQFFVPGRSCDVFDWVSDLAGVVLGAGAVWAWAIIAERLSRYHLPGDNRQPVAESAAGEYLPPPR